MWGHIIYDKILGDDWMAIERIRVVVSGNIPSTTNTLTTNTYVKFQICRFMLKAGQSMTVESKYLVYAVKLCLLSSNFSKYFIT